MSKTINSEAAPHYMIKAKKEAGPGFVFQERKMIKFNILLDRYASLVTQQAIYKQEHGENDATLAGSISGDQFNLRRMMRLGK